MANVGSSEFKLSMTLFYLNPLPLATLSEDTQISQDCPMNASVFLSTKRLARALLSKQWQCSWCGQSFPLSWPGYSMGVWGVWEKAVWKRREEVCIYLCWWGMIFHFDLSADLLLDRLASSRSHEVTVSSTEGLAWASDSTGRDERSSSGMPAGAGEITFLAVSVRVDFHCAVHDTWRWVRWQHRSSPKSRFVYSQRQSKDLRRLNDRTDSVQLKWIMTWSFTGEICNKGYDIMGFGLLQSHPSSTHVQILIAKQTTLLFALFIQPRLTD